MIFNNKAIVAFLAIASTTHALHNEESNARRLLKGRGRGTTTPSDRRLSDRGGKGDSCGTPPTCGSSSGKGKGKGGDTCSGKGKSPSEITNVVCGDMYEDQAVTLVQPLTCDGDGITISGANGVLGKFMIMFALPV